VTIVISPASIASAIGATMARRPVTSTCELNGDELRREPRQVRKATLGSILAKARPGIRFNEHIEGARPSSSMPARLGSKESCRRGRTRLIAQGARRIG
jgi:hypothetical protein